MKTLSAAISLLALSTAFAAGAEAQRAPYGLPLAPGENCAVRWYERDGNGEMVAKTRADGRGRYELTITEGRETLIRASGNYQAGPWGEALLTRTFLSSRQADGSLQTGRWSAGRGGLRADLRVYDQRGNLICRDASIETRERHLLFESYQQPRRARVDMSALTRRW